MRKKRWTDEEFREAAKNSMSIADTLRRMGLVPKGGNYRTVHAEVRRLKVDVSHWLGRSSSKGRKRVLSRIPLSEVLIENCEYSRANLKNRLLKEGMLRNVCYVCGQLPEWNGKELILVIDHENGINNDNRIENLRILCPHCNSQQNTFCGRKNLGVKMIKREIKCQDCGCVITRGALWCTRCSRIRSRKVERPSFELLIEDMKKMSREAIGIKYGVSGNAVKKWIRQYQEAGV